MDDEKNVEGIIQDGKVGGARLREISFLLRSGQISFDLARHQAKAPLAALNAGMRAFAEKHGYTFKPVGLSGFFR